MPHRPLAAVLKMRQLAVEDARRAVRNCILAEAAAEEAVAASEAAIASEIAAALNLAAEDADVEAFALWLPEAQRRAQNAQARPEVAQQETARARAQRSATRVQAEVISQAIDQQNDEVNAEEARREQIMLDEHRPPKDHPDNLDGR